MRRTTTLAALAAATALAVPVGLPASPAAATETCDGKVATIVVTARAGQYRTHPVTGTPGDDVIVGSAVGDTIDGAGGNDTICGLAGRDEIDGGAGDDRLFGGLDAAYFPDDDYFGDNVAPGPGDDHVDLGHDPESEDLHFVDIGYWDQISYRDATGPVTVDLGAGTATGEGNDTIVVPSYAGGIEGTRFADRLTGSPAHDWVTASGGDDVVVTLGGNDMVEQDHRTELVWSQREPEPGDDVVVTGDGGDTVRGGYGADDIETGPKFDDVYVEDGVGARVDGGGYRDELWGSGDTTLIGGGGADKFLPAVGDDNAVAVHGGPGRDILETHSFADLAPATELQVGRPAGTMRMRTAGSEWRTVLQFSSISVYRPTPSSRLPLTWYGTGGRDWLEARDHDAPVRAYGRGGRDSLTGGTRADLLDGGPGRDRLRGNDGRDRCVRGERFETCEVRR